MQVSKRLPDIQKIVNMFEDQGLIFELKHLRPANPVKTNGYTVARLLSSDGKTTMCEGAARCSISDNFDKAVGTRIAFHRMLHGLIAPM